MSKILSIETVPQIHGHDCDFFKRRVDKNENTEIVQHSCQITHGLIIKFTVPVSYDPICFNFLTYKSGSLTTKGQHGSRSKDAGKNKNKKGKDCGLENRDVGTMI